MDASEVAQLDSFFDNQVKRPTIGLMYGRRRIGKSTALVDQAQARGGFYFEATRVETPLQLDRLGRELGEFLDVGRIAIADWEEAIAALLRLGSTAVTPVILDEFGYIIEADASVESIVAAAVGPDARRRQSSRTRLMLCGSAIAMMRALTEGEAPLRGRAGFELVVHPDDFRDAATRLPNGSGLDLAPWVFAVIGGVVGYATDMVDFDLPTSLADFDRWIARRVLSPSATLHREATTLLAEDPTVFGSAALLHHSILGAIANGSVTAGEIANKVGKQVPNLTPHLKRLIDAGFVIRHEDPIRAQRPLYALNDSFLQFHYAVLDPFGSDLRDRDPLTVWDTRLKDVFGARVRGPIFEEQARTWVRRFASDQTLPQRDYVGPSYATLDGVDHELDVVVTGSGHMPGQRKIVAIGEAKAGEKLGDGHLKHLERVRAALGEKAVDAKLLLFGSSVDANLRKKSESREDVEIVDLDRLYGGD